MYCPAPGHSEQLCLFAALNWIYAIVWNSFSIRFLRECLRCHLILALSSVFIGRGLHPGLDVTLPGILSMTKYIRQLSPGFKRHKIDLCSSRLDQALDNYTNSPPLWELKCPSESFFSSAFNPWRIMRWGVNLNIINGCCPVYQKGFTWAGNKTSLNILHKYHTLHLSFSKESWKLELIRQDQFVSLTLILLQAALYLYCQSAILLLLAN